MPDAAVVDGAVQVKHLDVMMLRAKHLSIAAFAFHIAPSFTSTLSARGVPPLARSSDRLAAGAGSLAASDSCHGLSRNIGKGETACRT